MATLNSLRTGKIERLWTVLTVGPLKEVRFSFNFSLTVKCKEGETFPESLLKKAFYLIRRHIKEVLSGEQES